MLHPSLREKKRHTRVCKGRAVEGWACTATPQAPLLFNTRALHAPLPWEGERLSVIFYSARGFCTALLCGRSTWCPWVLGCPMLALTPPVSVICDSIVVHCFYFFCHCHYFGGMPETCPFD